MTTQSTETSRRLRVAKTTLIERMVINGQPVVIVNPTRCEPDVTYRVTLDDLGTATITEESA